MARRPAYEVSAPTIRPIKLKDGKFYWQALYRYYDNAGKQIQIKRNIGLQFKLRHKIQGNPTPEDATKDNRAEALRKAAEIFENVKAEVDTKKHQQEELENPDFASYCERWLNERKKGLKPLRNYTLRTYTDINRLLVNYFTKYPVKLRDFQKSHIMDFLEFEKSEGQKNLFRKNKHIRQILLYAYDQGIIDKLPTLSQKDKPKRETRGEIRYLNEDQLQELYVWSQGSIIEPVIILCGETGMRREEALGAFWNEINWNKRTIHICRTFTTELEALTKSNKGRRYIPLSPKLYDYLKNLKKQQSEDQALCGNGYKHSDHIIRRQDGSLIDPDDVSRLFRGLIETKILDDPYFPYVTLHGLRHTYNMQLEKSGFTASERAVLLGDDVETVTHHYTHNADNQDAIDKFNGTYWNKN